MLDILMHAPPPSPPQDIWHDTAFQLVVIAFVTILAGAIGGFVSYWIFRKQRIQKQISYQIISDAPIASINKEVEDRVEIRFDGNPIKDMSLLVLKVWNSGNVAVNSDDYFEAIKFVFEGRAVISADVLETEPKNLIDSKVIKTFLKREQEAIELLNFPLNPKDSISIKLLLTGSKVEISRRGRISDGEIIEFDQNIHDPFVKTINRINVVSGIILFIIGIPMLIILFVFAMNSLILLILLIFLLLLSVFNATIAVIRDKRTKKTKILP